jgi:multicomponent Na+:H+ antiporter subunit G
MMLVLALDILSYAMIAAGVFFLLVGAIGLLRFPEFFTRLHATGVTDTGGAELILLGLMLQTGWSFETIKLALIALFLFLTSPTATHAIANAAYVAGLRPMKSRYEAGSSPDEVAGDPSKAKS